MTLPADSSSPIPGADGGMKCSACEDKARWPFLTPRTPHVATCGRNVSAPLPAEPEASGLHEYPCDNETCGPCHREAAFRRTLRAAEPETSEPILSDAEIRALHPCVRGEIAPCMECNACRLRSQAFNEKDRRLRQLAAAPRAVETAADPDGVLAADMERIREFMDAKCSGHADCTAPHGSVERIARALNLASRASLPPAADGDTHLLDKLDTMTGVELHRTVRLISEVPVREAIRSVLRSRAASPKETDRG